MVETGLCGMSIYRKQYRNNTAVETRGISQADNLIVDTMR
jgi:hypothetical protein